jgi:hypothetical protein
MVRQAAAGAPEEVARLAAKVEPGGAYPLELAWSEGEVGASFAGAGLTPTAKAGWPTARVGCRGSGGAMAFRELRVAGTLDRGWLREALRQAAAHAAPAPAPAPAPAEAPRVEPEPPAPVPAPPSAAEP